MKTLCLWMTGFALLTQTPALSAADDAAATAAAIAERQDAAERYNRLSSQIDDLVRANDLLQKRIATLEQQIGTLRDDNARAAANKDQYASREDLKQVAENLTQTIKQLDERRVEDNQKIVAAFEEFKKLLKSAPVAPPPTREISRPSNPTITTNDATPTDTGAPRVGFTHSVAKGEYLMNIIDAYNKELKETGVKGKITLDSVLKANPGLDPNKMRVGQKVFLPKPAE